MYAQINSKTLTKAGQFSLSDIKLISYTSAFGGNEPKKVSVKNSVIEINIYEDIFNKGLSGNIVLADGQNVANHLPLTGFERIEFKLNTPSISKGYDFTSKTGHPMYIYKISDRRELAKRSQIYVLHFASKEVIYNEQVRVKSAKQGTIDQIVLDTMRNELNTNKTIIVEETQGIRKYIPPTLRPFDFIDMISKEAQSARFNNTGMFLYEDATGFRFRSLENMLAITDGAARPVVARFEKKPRAVKDGTGVTNIIQEMQTVNDFNIVSQYDTLKNLRNGVYASQIVGHDSFNKTFSEFNFDYNLQFQNLFHTEHDGNGGKTDNKSIAPLVNYNGKFFGDFTEGTRYFETNTQNVHTNYLRKPINTTLDRLSQRLAFMSMRVSLEARGFTGLSVGDMVALEIPSYEPAGRDNPLDNDPYMSGRYLVKSIRHKINTSQDMHTMAVECMKDATRVPYPEEATDTFTGRENEDKLTVLQYQLDDTMIETANDTQNEILT